MRMNWFDWLATKSHPNPRRRPERKRGKGTKMSKWVVHLPANGRIEKLAFFAFTKSEARAMLKQSKGLSRLPVGLAFTKV